MSEPGRPMEGRQTTTKQKPKLCVVKAGLEENGPRIRTLEGLSGEK